MWTEYAIVCERILEDDPANDTDRPVRAQNHIAMMVHKALIFREVGDTERYGEELVIAEDYAYNYNFDDISQALQHELA